LAQRRNEATGHVQSLGARHCRNRAGDRGGYFLLRASYAIVLVYRLRFHLPSKPPNAAF
jgi:hypothetical protein